MTTDSLIFWHLHLVHDRTVAANRVDRGNEFFVLRGGQAVGKRLKTVSADQSGLACQI